MEIESYFDEAREERQKILVHLFYKKLRMVRWYLSRVKIVTDHRPILVSGNGDKEVRVTEDANDCHCVMLGFVHEPRISDKSRWKDDLKTGFRNRLRNIWNDRRSRRLKSTVEETGFGPKGESGGSMMLEDGEDKTFETGRGCCKESE